MDLIRLNGFDIIALMDGPPCALPSTPLLALKSFYSFLSCVAISFAVCTKTSPCTHNHLWPLNRTRFEDRRQTCVRDKSPNEKWRQEHRTIFVKIEKSGHRMPISRLAGPAELAARDVHKWRQPNPQGKCVIWFLRSCICSRVSPVESPHTVKIE